GDVYSSLMLLAVLFSIAMLAPNSQILLRRFEPALNWKDYILPPTFFDPQLILQPSILCGLFFGCCFAVSVLSFLMSRNSSISISDLPAAGSLEDSWPEHRQAARCRKRIL